MLGKTGIPQVSSALFWAKRNGESFGILWSSQFVTGWWFGTFFSFPYIGDNHPNWLILFRGFQTTNQVIFKDKGSAEWEIALDQRKNDEPMHGKIVSLFLDIPNRFCWLSGVNPELPWAPGRGSDPPLSRVLHVFCLSTALRKLSWTSLQASAISSRRSWSMEHQDATIIKLPGFAIPIWGLPIVWKYATWMACGGKPYWNGWYDPGVPLFLETTIFAPWC